MNKDDRRVTYDDKEPEKRILKIMVSQRMPGRYEKEEKRI